MEKGLSSQKLLEGLGELRRLASKEPINSPLRKTEVKIRQSVMELLESQDELLKEMERGSYGDNDFLT